MLISLFRYYWRTTKCIFKAFLVLVIPHCLNSSHWAFIHTINLGWRKPWPASHRTKLTDVLYIIVSSTKEFEKWRQIVKDKLSRCLHCLQMKPKFEKNKILTGHSLCLREPITHLHLDFMLLPSDHQYEWAKTFSFQDCHWWQGCRNFTERHFSQMGKWGILEALDSDGFGSKSFTLHTTFNIAVLS